MVQRFSMPAYKWQEILFKKTLEISGNQLHATSRREAIKFSQTAVVKSIIQKWLRLVHFNFHLLMFNVWFQFLKSLQGMAIRQHQDN